MVANACYAVGLLDAVIASDSRFAVRSTCSVANDRGAEQFARPKPVATLPPWQNQDALQRNAGLQQQSMTAIVQGDFLICMDDPKCNFGSMF